MPSTRDDEKKKLGIVSDHPSSCGSSGDALVVCDGGGQRSARDADLEKIIIEGKTELILPLSNSCTVHTFSPSSHSKLHPSEVGWVMLVHMN